MEENKRKEYTIVYERGHYVVYDEEGNDCGQYDTPRDAREDYPDAR